MVILPRDYPSIPSKYVLRKFLVCLALKYHQKGRVGDEVFAIFQTKGRFGHEQLNEEDLHAELKTLRRAEYFLEDFYGRLRYRDNETLVPGKYPNFLCVIYLTALDFM